MDDHGPNGINGRILAELLAQGSRLGRIEGWCESVDGHLASIDRRLDAGSSQMHVHGAEIERHDGQIKALRDEVEASRVEASQRAAHISEQIRSFNSRYNADVITGVHSIAELRGEAKGRGQVWRRILSWGGLAIAALSAGAGLAQLQHCTATAAVTAPADAGERR